MLNLHVCRDVSGYHFGRCHGYGCVRCCHHGLLLVHPQVRVRHVTDCLYSCVYDLIAHGCEQNAKAFANFAHFYPL